MNPFEEAQIQDKVSRPRCPIAILLRDLPDEEVGYLTGALKMPYIQHSTIASLLTDWGHRTTANSVSRHRNRDCSCESV